jgi:potassium efflux system protein
VQSLPRTFRVPGTTAFERSLAPMLFLALVTFAAALLSLGLPAIAQAQDTGTAPAVEAPASEQPNGQPSVPPGNGTETANGTPATLAAALPELAVPVPGFNEQVRRELRRIPLELDRLQKATDRLRGDGEGLASVRLEAETLQIEAQRVIGNLEPLLPDLRTQLSRLGEPPKQGEPPETEIIQTERRNLNQAVSVIDGAIKQMRLTETRIAQLVSRLQEARHVLLARDLLELSRSPLSGGVWSVVLSESGAVAVQIYRFFATWFAQIAENAIAFTGVLLLAGLTYLVSVHVRDPFVASRLAEVSATPPPIGFLKRTKLAAVLAPAFALPRVLVVAIIAAGFHTLSLFNGQVDPVLVAAAWAFLIYVAVSSLAHALLLPGYPALRLVGVDEHGASRLGLLTRLLAAVSAVDLVVFAAIGALYLSEPFAVVAGAVSALLFAVLLVAIVRIDIEEDEATDGGRLLATAFRWARLPTYATALAIVVSAAAGYLTLARFISAQVLVLGCGFVVLFLVHRGTAALFDGDRSESSAHAAGDQSGLHVASATGASADADQGRPTRAIDIVRYILNVLVVCAGFVALLMSWGFSASDITSWTRTVIVGFDVGGVRISPAQILTAILLFAGLVVLTRLVQRWLSGNVLDTRRMDAGLANSIHTGIGYAGTAIAVLVGVSYAGLDVTNLAIVAGALSVGIGFGLQSIVNNFVSGLILLIERPIKVGDWIVVGEHQGYVRRISVRSTEIETFDRASLILPNSELITGTVQNWTHRNSMGRVVVPVGVSYDCDPEHVVDVLKAAVARCESLLKFPQPFISFDNFGDSSLDFTVRAYIRDVNNSLSAKTEIRTAIAKAFKAEGIEIPFPQRDIHLRDLDGVRQMMAKAGEKRKAEGGDVPENPLENLPREIRDFMKG